LIQRPILSRCLTLLIIFSVFFTPLLFFIHAHDQFELPKLTFLMVLLLPGVLLSFNNKAFFAPTPLTLSLYLLAFTQILASFPTTSLSWRTSLLGDYENFSGLATLFTYLVLFELFSLHLTREKIEKIFNFNSIAAIFSSLYAVGQHYGFDFIQWNEESVNPSREFAALGNPNFLSAYLAMSIPLFLSQSLKTRTEAVPSYRPPALFSCFLAPLGLFCLILGTSQGFSLFHLAPSAFANFIFRLIGLFLLCAASIPLVLYRHWITTLCGLAILGLGLFSTGSRGGFLGALLGVGVWIWLALRKKEFSTSMREKFASIPRIFSAAALLLTVALLLFVGHGFLSRLGDSVLHMGRSLATSRLHIWRPALRIVEANPLLGVGLDNFKIAFPYYSGIEFNEIDGMFMSSRMAHNELLQMASTTGLLGLGAYLGVLAAFGMLWWKTYRSSTASVQLILIAVLACAVAYHVQNFFSFGVASINVIWVLLLAIVQNLYRAGPGPYVQPPSGWKFYAASKKAALVVFSVFLLFFPISRLGADIAFGQSNAASEILKNPDPRLSNADFISYSNYEISHLRKAVGLSPLEVKYQLYLGLAYDQRLSKIHRNEPGQRLLLQQRRPGGQCLGRF
jgi:O-antigen ligase